MKKNKRMYRSKNNAFTPNSAYIEAATAAFLELGGEIEILEYEERAQNFDVVVTEPMADSFLMGD